MGARGRATGDKGRAVQLTGVNGVWCGDKGGVDLRDAIETTCLVKLQNTFKPSMQPPV